MVLKTVNRLLKKADILEEALNIHHFQFATPVEKNYYYDIGINYEPTVPVIDCDQQVKQLHCLHFYDENNVDTNT